MKNIIVNKLKEIEIKYDIKILYAIESGSRAWEFASKDSDYDVRFIYIRKKKDYLSLHPIRDVIEDELNDIYDINGWDIRKMLLLLEKGNPVLFEWLNSPILYYARDEFLRYKDDLMHMFNPCRALFHYESLGKKDFYLHIEDKARINLKKYLYTLRALLARKWIYVYHSIPPLSIKALMQLLPTEIQPVVNRLLEEKKNATEVKFIEPIVVLNQYIEHELKSPYNIEATVHASALNDIFLSLLEVMD